MLEYDVNLDIMESKDSEGVDNRLSSSYVAIEFNGGEKKLLNTLESVETSYPKTDYTPVEGRYLVSGELGSNESKSYSLKLWMDESVTIEDNAMNKNFISKVVVTAKQSHVVRLVDYVMSDNEIEEFEHAATSQTKALTDYRYTGANPNNYVYFGCEGDTCTEDNLYRIIGVMPTQSEIGGEYENRVKLIKASDYEENESGLYSSSIGYDWNTGYSSDWTKASLNTKVLNGVYWSNLKDYQKYIAASVWYLGTEGYLVIGPATAEELYNYERGSVREKGNGPLYTINNVGLMYLSDYVYSVGKSYISKAPRTNKEIYKTNAWLIFSDRQYAISGNGDHNDDFPSATCVYSDGNISGSIRVHFFDNDPSDQYKPYYRASRPTFYLKTNVLYESGNGKQESPFRISINE